MANNDALARAALEDAIAIIEGLDCRDNSCDPPTDLTELKAALQPSKPPSDGDMALALEWFRYWTGSRGDVDAPHIAAIEEALIAYQALLDELDALKQALWQLPDDIDMVEHNPDEGTSYFCCGTEVIFNRHPSRGSGFIHAKDCWYTALIAIRDSKEE